VYFSLLGAGGKVRGSVDGGGFWLLENRNQWTHFSSGLWETVSFTDIETGRRGSGALITEKKRNVWIVDSKATEHMTDKREWISNFLPIPIGNWPMAIIGDW
jgi:hypothetical protein